MVKHLALGGNSFAQLRQLKIRIDNNEIQLGGNSNLKIYGTLSCKSGKRMKSKNRVFFENEAAAIAAGYRPCGHCMRAKYKLWKISNPSKAIT